MFKGENPWQPNQEATFKIFDWIIYRNSASTTNFGLITFLMSALVLYRIF